MKDGDIIEQGNHKELLEKGGFYAKLYNSQFAVQIGIDIGKSFYYNVLCHSKIKHENRLEREDNERRAAGKYNDRKRVDH